MLMFDENRMVSLYLICQTAEFMGRRAAPFA